MSIKESSDELNPAIPVTETLAATRTPHSVKSYLALSIATCGVGYLPLAPGTWGSLLAVAVFWYARAFWAGGSIDHAATEPEVFFVYVLLPAIMVITFAGIWAASRTERVLKIKDPGKVVIDEVAGQLIALLPLALTRISTPLVVIAFVLFRFFDMVKPYPARKFESLHGGLGIMADDLVAGAYAAVIVAFVARLSWFS
ncbi:MAG TPA: phosphatidylglycerophosphatase A [Pyrinomonadaceae bacterium]|jgi:phosphatidylglycerophosphatase A